MKIKSILRILKISLLSLIGFLLLYVVAAFGLSRIAVNEDVEPVDEVKIFILSNGVHTDIVVPVKTESHDWSDHVKFEDTKGGDSLMNYVGFGWGDKGFYLQTPTWADLKFSVAFKAAFALSKSAIHATFHKQITEGENCVAINISKAHYEQLVEFISQSFEKDQSNKIMCIKTDANYGPNDAFYEALGSYSLFHTCNTWANNALKSCGQKVSLWTPFDTGIFYHYK